MFDAIKRLVVDFAQREENPLGGVDDTQLAAAALLFRVIAVDGVVSQSEREMLTHVLSRRFSLEPAQIVELVQAAETADADAVDLYTFTSVLKRRLALPERERIIEMMWQLVYAYGSVHELEDNVVWRVAELLDVPARTRVLLKKEARDEGR